MRVSTGMGLALLAFGASAADLGTETEDPVVAQVLARDAELQAAHGRGDMASYRAGLSRRYVYIDIGGQRVTAEKMESRRANDHRRVVSSEASEEEAIRLADNVVLLRGLEHGAATYYGGLPRIGASRWSALWVREDDGVWRLTADTATPVRNSEALPFMHVPQTDATLAALTGRWTLALQPEQDMLLAVEQGKLIATLPGYPAARFVFAPASATHYFAEERPFELRFAPDGKSMSLVTWGTPTAAIRTGE